MDSQIKIHTLEFARKIGFKDNLTFSQSYLQSWIRYNLNIDIEVYRNNTVGTYMVCIWIPNKDVKSNPEQHYIPKIRVGHIQSYYTYAEALEVGLMLAMENSYLIIKT